jgi:hypothetical protein
MRVDVEVRVGGLDVLEHLSEAGAEKPERYQPRRTSRVKLAGNFFVEQLMGPPGCSSAPVGNVNPA